MGEKLIPIPCLRDSDFIVWGVGSQPQNIFLTSLPTGSVESLSQK